MSVRLESRGLNNFYARIMVYMCVSMVLGVIVARNQAVMGCKAPYTISHMGSGEKRMAAFKVYCGAHGKMSGVSHISIAAGQSPVCKACKLGKICYADRYQRLFPSSKKSYHENGEKLTEKVHDMKDIPYVNTMRCRFNAFGEVFNGAKGRIQLMNYVQTCRKNPGVTFVLWSRNYRTVGDFFSKDCERPSNLKLIRSTSDIDAPLYEVPLGWDGVFNVVSKEFVDQNHTTVNCGVKDEYGAKVGCARCNTGCYVPDAKNVVVFEIKK